jgi:hypothetical protein
MKLSEYIEKMNEVIDGLNELIKEGNDFEVVYSKDDEGNEYQPVYFTPIVGYYQDREFTSELENRKPNAICIN